MGEEMGKPGPHCGERCKQIALLDGGADASHRRGQPEPRINLRAGKFPTQRGAGQGQCFVLEGPVLILRVAVGVTCHDTPLRQRRCEGVCAFGLQSGQDMRNLPGNFAVPGRFLPTLRQVDSEPRPLRFHMIAGHG